MLSSNSQASDRNFIAAISKSKMLDDIIVATTDDSSDDRLVDYVTELGFKTYRDPARCGALLFSSFTRKCRCSCSNYSRLSVN